MIVGKRRITIFVVVILFVTFIYSIKLSETGGDLSDPLSLTSHNPIHIIGDSQFTLSNGVVAGDGSISNPYIIENWSINASQDHGIWIENTNASFIIRNCYISNGTFGSSSYHGIYFVNVKNGSIINNNLTLNNYGIRFYHSDDNLIYNNTIHNNLFGIYFSDSNRNYILNNKLNNHSIIGIGFNTKSSNNKISKNIFKLNIRGVTIGDFSSFNEISKNIFENNNGTEVYVCYDSNYNLITNNIIYNKIRSSTGLGIFRADHNKVLNNTCSDNRWGIVIDWANSNIVKNNTCFKNEFGISIDRGKSNIITNNTCYKNDNGIKFYDNSDLNTITNNTITWNRYSGINITSNDINDNLIYNNYFNNTINYKIEHEDSNIWNISKTPGKNIIGGPYLGGNFWSDYMGKDINDDGLGDTDLPYGPGDYLPLTDIFPPGIMDNTSGTPTTGDEFSFEAVAWDDNIVRSVHVEYRYNYGNKINLTMNRTKGDIKNGTYSQMINVSSDATKLYYNLSVADTGWNWIATAIRSMNVLDNDKPIITDLSPIAPTTGDNFTFEISVSDNIKISKVYLEFWFDDGNHKNETLSLNDGLFSHTTLVPINAKKLHYFVSAVDGSNNWAATEYKILDVIDNDKPEIIDKSSNPTTGDGFTFVFQVSDNIDISTVYLEYWYDGGARTNITLGNNFSHPTNVPLNTFVLNALVTALDTSNNIEQLVVNKLILDNDAPIIEDLTTGNPETGREFSIKCSVNENHLIKNVLLEYWFDKGGHTPVPMNFETDSYNLQIKVPEDAKTLYYKITVDDNSNNSVNIENNLAVIDIIPPGLQDLTEGTPTTGDEFEIKAVAQDNIKVESLYLEYWFNNNGHENVSFNNALVIIVSIDAEILHYKLTAYDMAGNIESLSNHLDVIDNDAPLIIDNTSEPTTGDSLQFNAEINDNIAIISSYLEYWFDNNTHINISFDGLYSTIAPNNARVLNYIIFAEDGNKNTARIQAIKNVIDNDKPLIIDLSPQNATTGDFFNVTAFIVDNILISHVNVEYWFDIEHFQINMELIDGNYIKSIHVSENATELSYKIFAIDSSGNDQSLENKIDVKDNDRPSIEDRSLEAEDGFNFKAEVQDNIGVSEVKVEYRFDNGENITKILQLKEDNYEEVITNPGNAKRIYYRVSAVDTSGNWNSTEEKELELEPSKPSSTSEHDNPWLILAIIIVIIVIVIIIFIVFIKRRKQKIKEKIAEEVTTSILTAEATPPLEKPVPQITPQVSEMPQLTSEQPETSEPEFSRSLAKFLIFNMFIFANY